MANLQGSQRSKYVEEMFDRISKRYDLMNSLMSAGRHKNWRREATIEAVSNKLSGECLDVATGTGDFIFDLLKHDSVSKVTGLDFSKEMLAIAHKKIEELDLVNEIDLIKGDVHHLPFDDKKFICVTVGFGTRNFIDVPLAIAEMSRVIQPRGKLVILEILRMEGLNPLKKIIPPLLNLIMPLMGKIITGDREAYSYLPKSVDVFLTATELATIMEENGFENIKIKKKALGTVAIISGEKP